MIEMSRSARVAAVILLGWGLQGATSVGLAQQEGSQPEAPFSRGQRAVNLQGEQYGTVPITDPVARRVNDVFAKLIRVSGKRPGAVFEVYLLNTQKILVQAMPGGAVLISRGAADLTNGDDHALAFLLAHEIAHEVRDHHGLLGSFQKIPLAGASQLVPTQRQAEDGRAVQGIELEADRLGLLFTSLAGYRAKAAIPILERVIALTGSGPFHPDPRSRARNIREAIEQISAQVELFNVGVFYLTIGQYQVAAKIFDNFQSLFPSREVYANQGVAYHKLALQHRLDDGLRRSLMIDPETLAKMVGRDTPGTRLRTRGSVTDPVFSAAMERAVSAYRLAVEIDPDYTMGHNNLGVAYLDLGEYDYAIGEFKRALRAVPELRVAYLNRGVAYLKNGDTARAEADLQRAAALDPTDPDPHVNLSHLYHHNGKSGSAQQEAKAAEWLESQRRVNTGAVGRRREAMGAIVIGMPVDLAKHALGGSPTRTLSVSVNLADELTVLIYEAQGVILVARGGRVEAVSATEGYRGKTVGGIGIGGAVREVQIKHGYPPRVAETLIDHLWHYPGQALVMVITGDHVARWWIY
ncbi:MAG: tetratricopeptide repeat protein [candidate division NC10 bacterium]|nr:tetratricopeptide repeat protein [candidate division NC10 bacterium]